ncbi:MAG: hypothetical protein QG628_233 [Patescibacteria group bacterium]|nr:hypothetical protein [Patescibacteria group bacterium]
MGRQKERIMQIRVMIIIAVLLLSAVFAPLAANWYVSSIEEANQMHQEIMEKHR